MKRTNRKRTAEDNPDTGMRCHSELPQSNPQILGGESPHTTGQEPSRPAAHQAIRPRWDEVRGELTVNGHLIKCHRKPAPNQRIILAAFQEEAWPPRIDNPLPPPHNLRSAIQNLNSGQSPPTIHFRADGTGEALLWEWVPRVASDRLPRQSDATGTGAPGN